MSTTEAATASTVLRPRRTPTTQPVGLLVGLLLLRTAALFLGDGLGYGVFRTTGTPQPWAHALLAANVSVVLLADVGTVVVLRTLLHRDGRRLRDLLAPRRLGRDLALGLALAPALLLALLAATYLANLAVYAGPPPAAGPVPAVPLWLGLWSLLLMPVTVAVAEEALYRGFLLPAWAARIGWWPAAILVSVAFGVQHAAFSASSPGAAAARVLTTTLLGLVFALLARRLGRVFPLAVAHWLVDVVGLGLPMLLVALSGVAR